MVVALPSAGRCPRKPFETHGFAVGYERNGIYSVEFVLSNLDKLADFCGDVIPLTSLRYHTFALRTDCVNCGVKGVYFAKERSALLVKNAGTIGVWRAMYNGRGNRHKWHLNMYAIKDGREVLMTKDHIKPKCHGGPDKLENLQTMCAPCNCSKKDNTLDLRYNWRRMSYMQPRENQ
jgi:5-methylcytosine-specific restriction endonuclease McrA